MAIGFIYWFFYHRLTRVLTQFQDSKVKLTRFLKVDNDHVKRKVSRIQLETFFFFTV